MIQLQGAGINIGEVGDFQNGGSWKAAVDALNTASEVGVDPKCGDCNACVLSFNILRISIRDGIGFEESGLVGVCLWCLSEHGDDLFRREVCLRHPSGDVGAGILHCR
jgi:hypothetical protein